MKLTIRIWEKGQGMPGKLPVKKFRKNSTGCRRFRQIWTWVSTWLRRGLRSKNRKRRVRVAVTADGEPEVSRGWSLGRTGTRTWPRRRSTGRRTRRWARRSRTSSRACTGSRFATTNRDEYVVEWDCKITEEVQFREWRRRQVTVAKWGKTQGTSWCLFQWKISKHCNGFGDWEI